MPWELLSSRASRLFTRARLKRVDARVAMTRGRPGQSDAVGCRSLVHQRHRTREKGCGSEKRPWGRQISPPPQSNIQLHSMETPWRCGHMPNRASLGRCQGPSRTKTYKRVAWVSRPLASSSSGSRPSRRLRPESDRRMKCCPTMIDAAKASHPECASWHLVFPELCSDPHTRLCRPLHEAAGAMPTAGKGPPPWRMRVEAILEAGADTSWDDERGVGQPCNAQPWWVVCGVQKPSSTHPPWSREWMPYVMANLRPS